MSENIHLEFFNDEPSYYVPDDKKESLKGKGPIEHNLLYSSVYLQKQLHHFDKLYTRRMLQWSMSHRMAPIESEERSTALDLLYELKFNETFLRLLKLKGLLKDDDIRDKDSKSWLDFISQLLYTNSIEISKAPGFHLSYYKPTMIFDFMPRGSICQIGNTIYLNKDNYTLFEMIVSLIYQASSILCTYHSINYGYDADKTGLVLKLPKILTGLILYDEKPEIIISNFDYVGPYFSIINIVSNIHNMESIINMNYVEIGQGNYFIVGKLQLLNLKTAILETFETIISQAPVLNN